MCSLPVAYGSRPKKLHYAAWNCIGLCYRHKTKREVADDKKKREKANKNFNLEPKASVDDWFPDHEESDPRDLPYVFVAVYASLMSLMVSVKAWQTRRKSGQVQFCCDNMYN